MSDDVTLYDLLVAYCDVIRRQEEKEDRDRALFRCNLCDDPGCDGVHRG